MQAATPSGALRALDRLWAVPQKLREAVLLGAERAAALDDVMRAYMFVIPKVWLHDCCLLTLRIGDSVLPAEQRHLLHCCSDQSLRLPMRQVLLGSGGFVCLHAAPGALLQQASKLGSCSAHLVHWPTHSTVCRCKAGSPKACTPAPSPPEA